MSADAYRMLTLKFSKSSDDVWGSSFMLAVEKGTAALKDSLTVLYKARQSEGGWRNFLRKPPDKCCLVNRCRDIYADDWRPLEMMSLFPSKMDYSIYRMVGQMQDAERVTVKKPGKRSYHCQHKWTYKDYPECPRWHQTALRLASIALVSLVATVIGLVIHVNHLSVHPLSDKHNEGILGNNESRCCGCMDISPRKQQQDKINSTGKSCPDDWFQKQGKCYKFYMNFTSWIDSEISCAVRKSHLLVIQDKAELDFIQSKIHDGVYFWIGLNVTDTQKTWTWLDGTPLHPHLFQVTGQVEDDACALITRKGVFSEKCFIHNYWICQYSSTEDNV